VKVFDIYQDAELAKERKKSVSFHLIFQSSKKTLEKTEVEENLARIINHLIKTFPVEKRN
jgi:phenylalanyl-tRNA synthetase beta subunit